MLMQVSKAVHLESLGSLITKPDETACPANFAANLARIKGQPKKLILVVVDE
jgi:hypothetical protein